MKNNFFRFKQFLVSQDRSAMKVTTDACLFGAWVAEKVKHDQVKNLLDIGTGTGLLSLMVSQKSTLNIQAVEIDPGAVSDAKENFDSSPWHDRIHLINEDARKISFDHPFDIILSNPPFYEKEIVSTAHKKNLAHHGEGLLFVELIDLIKKNLIEKGNFYFMLPFKRYNECLRLIKKAGLKLNEAMLVSQSTGHDFFRFFLKGSFGEFEEDFKSTEMSIWNDKKEYTAEFVDLLKDYYLYL